MFWWVGPREEGGGASAYTRGWGRRDDVVQREYERYYAKNAEAVEAEGVPDLATRGVFEEEARRMEDEVWGGGSE